VAFELDRIYPGDCLELMREMPEQSVDLVLTDPPYGVTQNRWDVPVPFEDLWAALGRVVKDRAPTVMFGIPPFSSQAIVSNPKWFRYSWIWDKHAPAPTVCNPKKVYMVHPEECRNISLAEAAALQGFPPDYIWHGSEGAIAQMIANAMPAEMAAAVAGAIA